MSQTIQQRKHLEQAIALALLDVPEFRQKAGLPPRQGSHGGETLQLLADVMGLTREGVRLIERSALRKMHAAIAANPQLFRALRHLINALKFYSDKKDDN